MKKIGFILTALIMALGTAAFSACAGRESDRDRRPRVPSYNLVYEVTETEMEIAGVTCAEMEEVFRKNGYKRQKDILYADIRQDGLVYVNPKYGNFFTETLKIKTGDAW